jgi:hypothetical protein
MFFCRFAQPSYVKSHILPETVLNPRHLFGFVSQAVEPHRLPRICSLSGIAAHASPSSFVRAADMQALALQLIIPDVVQMCFFYFQ